MRRGRLFKDIAAMSLDFDGTIANTHDTHTFARMDGCVDMFDETGDVRWLQIDPDIHHLAFHEGGGTTESITRWVIVRGGIASDERDGPAAVDELRDRLQAHKTRSYEETAMRGLDAYPGAVEFIPRAHRRHAGNIAVATTADLRYVEAFTKRHQLQKYFPASRIFHGGMVASKKPDPEVYGLVLDEFGLRREPRRLVAVEDNKDGILAAKLAGATVVGIANSDNAENLLSFEGTQAPDLVVESFEELDGYFGK